VSARERRNRLFHPRIELAQLQVALGLLWVLDGLLQLQPSQFGAQFTVSLEENAMAQPELLRRVIFATTHLIGPHIALYNAGFATVQLLLGTLILLPSTRRIGLLISLPWALGVWVIGEGLGSVLTGFGILVTGAPGAALLYGVAALVLLPPPRRSSTLLTSPSDDQEVGRRRAEKLQMGESRRAPRVEVAAAASESALGERFALGCWVAIFAGAAVLEAIPGPSFSFKLQANFVEQAIGESRLFVVLDHATAHLLGGRGLAVSLVLIALELAIALGGLTTGRPRRLLVFGGITACALFWVVGENLGGILSGQGNDPGQFPVLLLLGLAIWPRRPADAASTGLVLSSWSVDRARHRSAQEIASTT